MAGGRHPSHRIDAIPGIAAKPVIDMMAGVRDLDKARATYGPGLARKHPCEPGAYTAGKRAFVAQVLAGAGIEPGRR